MSIGNDVVDLGRPRTMGKSRDARFLRRVFTTSESEWIRSAADPDRVLWMLWSAKESAFKVARRRHPDLPFAHRCFDVSVSPTERRAIDDGALLVHGTVAVGAPLEVDDAELAVHWEMSDAMVHCLALGSAADVGSVRAAVSRVREDENGPERWTPRERQSAVTAESREARAVAKRLAGAAGLGDVEVVRRPGSRRFGPPLLYPAGGATPLEGWELSLSHDGAYAGAALARRSPLEGVGCASGS